MDRSSWVYLTHPLFTKRERWHEKRRGEERRGDRETEKRGFAMSQICGNGTWKGGTHKVQIISAYEAVCAAGGIYAKQKKKKKKKPPIHNLLDCC
jgi:hypothetical protein